MRSLTPLDLRMRGSFNSILVAERSSGAPVGTQSVLPAIMPLGIRCSTVSQTNFSTFSVPGFCRIELGSHLNSDRPCAGRQFILTRQDTEPVLQSILTTLRPALHRPNGRCFMRAAQAQYSVIICPRAVANASRHSKPRCPWCLAVAKVTHRGGRKWWKRHHLVRAPGM
jgi:hypothetical protein